MLAHPDANDVTALLDYANEHNRLNEIREVDFSCPCLKATSDHAVGLYNLPSSALFYDFCKDLSSRLPHDMIRGKVESVDMYKASDVSASSAYTVTVSGGAGAGQQLQTRHVVLALGAAGGPKIPTPFTGTFNAGGGSVLHTMQCDRLKEIAAEDVVLVVGGGLSAAQAALLAVAKGAKETILCSRRPLTTRQFDVPLDWVNPTRNRRCRYEFFGLPDEDKAAWAYQVRGGGSVPKDYMDRLRAAEAAGQLKMIVDDVKRCECRDGLSEGGRLCVKLAGRTVHPTRVVLATGSQAQSVSNPLCSALADKFALPIAGGLPVLSDSLRWGEENFYVVGALALLRLGPDAANLMGARRGAQLCATELGTFDDLYAQGDVYSNRFTTLDMVDPDFF